MACCAFSVNLFRSMGGSFVCGDRGRAIVPCLDGSGTERMRANGRSETVASRLLWIYPQKATPRGKLMGTSRSRRYDEDDDDDRPRRRRRDDDDDDDDRPRSRRRDDDDDDDYERP